MKDAAQFFKVLADEARLKTIWLLFHHDELCVCDIMAACGQEHGEEDPDKGWRSDPMSRGAQAIHETQEAPT
jgi:hypothetical protein